MKHHTLKHHTPTQFLIINQGGHPVYHDEANDYVYDAATQVRALLALRLLLLLSPPSAQKRFPSAPFLLNGWRVWRNPQIHAISLQMRSSMGQTVRPLPACFAVHARSTRSTCR